MTIRAVLFDAVGTLIYPDPPAAETYHRVGRELGSLRTLAEIRSLFGDVYRRSECLFASSGNGNGLERQPTSEERERNRWRQVVGEVLDDLPSQAADEALDRLWQHFALPQHWRLYDEVAAAWRDLAEKGYLLGIASNFDRRLAHVCRGHPPLDACRHWFVSSEIGYPKPSPEFFRAVEARLRLDGSEILLVGDDWTNDVLGGRNCGWHVQHLVRQGPLREGAIGSLAELSIEPSQRRD